MGTLKNMPSKRYASNNLALSSAAPDKILIFAFFVAILLPYLNFFFLFHSSDREDSSLGTILSMLSLVIIFICVFGVAVIFNQKISVRSSGPAGILVLLFSLALLSSPLSLRPLFSASYALAAILLLTSLQLMFMATKARHFRDLLTSSWIILFLMMVLIIYHEIDFPRRVGGIQPNAWSKLSILAMALAFLSGSRNKILFAVMAILLTSFAASRGGLILIVMFLFIYILLSRPLLISVLTLFYSILAISLVFSTSFYLFPDFQTLIYRDVLAVEDSRRAIIGSGFSGRDEYWRLGLLIFSEGNIFNMVFGYGFATRMGTEPDDIRFISAHQGFINIMLDVGIVGLLLFVSSSFWAILNGIKAVRASQNIQFHAASVAFISAYLISMLIDPLYIRVGTSFSFLLFFLIVAMSQTERKCMVASQAH